MKKNKNIELKIYELLGVNVFRKYVLFTWEKIAKFFNLDVGYRLDKINTYGLLNYKERAKIFALMHTILLIGWSIFQITYPSSLVDILYNLIINGYCIMVQRYNIIRINNLIEKQIDKYKGKKEKNEENNLVSKINTHKIKKENIIEKSLSNKNSIESLKKYREYLEKIKINREINKNSNKNDLVLSEEPISSKSSMKL